MIKQTLTAALFTCFITPALAASVTGIDANGSVDGNTAYKITCSDGSNWRIWRSSGQWWDGRGAQGGQSRDLNEQASFLCR